MVGVDEGRRESERRRKKRDVENLNIWLIKLIELKESSTKGRFWSGEDQVLEGLVEFSKI